MILSIEVDDENIKNLKKNMFVNTESLFCYFCNRFKFNNLT